VGLLDELGVPVALDDSNPGPRFLITEVGPAGEAVLFEDDEWLKVIAWLELDELDARDRKSLSLREI
jgi:hypothetical protein